MHGAAAGERAARPATIPFSNGPTAAVACSGRPIEIAVVHPARATSLDRSRCALMFPHLLRPTRWNVILPMSMPIVATGSVESDRFRWLKAGGLLRGQPRKEAGE